MLKQLTIAALTIVSVQGLAEAQTDSFSFYDAQPSIQQPLPVFSLRFGSAGIQRDSVKILPKPWEVRSESGTYGPVDNRYTQSISTNFDQSYAFKAPELEPYSIAASSGAATLDDSRLFLHAYTDESRNTDSPVIQLATTEAGDAVPPQYEYTGTALLP